MRALGLDVGSKTIGVAVSDGLELTAQPLRTLSRRGTARDAEDVVALARAEGADTLVVGLPLDPEGNEGHRAARVRVLVDALRERFAGAVELWDESFTTVEAEQVLLEADLSRARRKQVIDKLAAAVILQGWLDARRAVVARHDS